jgi:glycosyltransferase involved in cell wall biosynthesis
MPVILVNLLQTTGTKGGIEVYARELYRTLGTMDHEFTFIGYASSELAAKDTSWFPGEVIDSGLSGENRLTWAWGEMFSVGHMAKKLNVDLIHGPAMFGPAHTRIPLVISFHDVLYFSHPELMQSKLFTEPVKMLERLGVRNATRIITISEYSSRGIQKYLHVPEERIDVIPLAGRTTLETRDRMPRASDVFLAVGQRSPYKDHETIVRAWAMIPDDERPQLVITGSHGNDPLIPLVDELGLGDWVRLAGWIELEELNRLFDTSTAFIDSTLAAGFGMPAIEAMNLGLPVVLADTEVFREVGGDAAEFYAAGDPRDLARVVTELQKHPSRLTELAEKGLARARNYSWDKVAASTLETFRRALSSSSESERHD